MNRKFVLYTSVLIAFLCHLFLFNFFTFEFPIGQDSPKPKFFFLGPILTQNDVKQNAPPNQDRQGQVTIKNMGSTKKLGNKDPDPKQNPFAIKTIKKPLAAQASNAQEKITMKSTFETSLKSDALQEDAPPERPEMELDIRPYRSLRIRGQ